MKAAVLYPDKTLQVTSLPIPDVPAGGALLKVSHCGVCGSDLEKVLYREMTMPTVLGHEVVGTLQTLSKEARVAFPHLSEGQRVVSAHHVPCQTCHYCRHGSPSMCSVFKQSNLFPGGFSETLVLSEAHLRHTMFPLPDHVSDVAATCIEPLACCLRAISRIPEQVGKTVLLIGLGFMGLLTAQALRQKGYTVIGTDRDQERQHFALQHQWIEAVLEAEMAHVSPMETLTQGRGVDVVFLTAVHDSTLAMALNCVRDGGVIMLFASSNAPVQGLDPALLYFRELSLLTSYSPGLADLQEAAALITEKQITLDSMPIQCYPLEGISDAMEAYRQGLILKAVIQL